MRLVVYLNITLDGVIQSPSSPDEDRRDGFEHGGWAPPYSDEVMFQEAAQGMAGEGAMLFGRRTYEQFATYWPHQPDSDPFANVLNNRMKYVVSTTLREPLPWKNSRLLSGVGAVRELKHQDGPDVVVLGSAELVQSLMRENLIDAYALNIHPIVLGSGRRLFADRGTQARLRLESATPTTTGVLLARYRAAD